MYFHVWEFDAQLPEITAAGRLTRIRQYRNLDRMPSLVRHFLARAPFTSIASHLALEPKPVPEAPRSVPHATPAASATDAGPRTPVTLVVPCFNEEGVLFYLSNTLARVRADLGHLYAFRFVFVDDGSSDETWKMLHEIFADLRDARFVRHPRNQGVAAAILTGIREAETEIVCSIDCDCTYDPHQLRELIPMLGEEVAMVTASPYHPSGRVHNVPGWRLFLSRTLSRLYAAVLSQRLHTYTSCFRAYRRSALKDLEVRERGFLGVAEMICALDRKGQVVVECPAVLEVRMLGRSKMKLFGVIAGHLRLLARMARVRWQAPAPEASEPQSAPMERRGSR
jgi:hypothetical protein